MTHEILVHPPCKKPKGNGARFVGQFCLGKRVSFPFPDHVAKDSGHHHIKLGHSTTSALRHDQHLAVLLKKMIPAKFQFRKLENVFRSRRFADHPSDCK